MKADAREIVGAKLIKKVSNFLWEVAQLGGAREACHKLPVAPIVLHSLQRAVPR